MCKLCSLYIDPNIFWDVTNFNYFLKESFQVPLLHLINKKLIESLQTIKLTIKTKLITHFKIKILDYTL